MAALRLEEHMIEWKTLAECPPDFRGIPLKDYLAECREQERARSKRWFEKHFPEPPLNRKSEWRKRDSYGILGV